MADHVKPTVEELEAERLQALKDIETPEDDENTVDADKKSEEDKNDKEEVEENKKDERTSDDNTEEDEGDTKEADDKDADKDEGKSEDDKDDDTGKEDLTYKKRYEDSSRESQILNAKIKKQNEVLEKAGQVQQPTDEEMSELVPEWDDLNQTMKTIARNNEWNTRRFAIIDDVAKENKTVEDWTKAVDTFIDDPKTLIANPRLEGKQDGFKAFAAKETRRGVDFETLTNAFLYKVDGERKHNKGKMFETGKNGPIVKKDKNDGKLSAAEGESLRVNNYREYQKQLSAGKIADDNYE